MSQYQKKSQDDSAKQRPPTPRKELHGSDKFTDDLVAETVSMIKHRIAVMSGKGGVGKSTVAVNIATSLAKAGSQVGVLDGDVHGPDIPLMFGLQGRIPDSASGYLLPLIAQRNIKVMSIGFQQQGYSSGLARSLEAQIVRAIPHRGRVGPFGLPYC